MAAQDDRATPTGPQGPRHHDIGPAGVVTIAVEADDVRVRGVEGTEARVVAPADGTGIETVAEPGRFTVRTARHVGIDKSGFVGIKIGTRGFGVPLRLRVSGTVEVDVPRDARVVVTAAAGDVAVRDVLGGVTLKTTSGDISVKRAAGSITAEAASGDVNVTGMEPVSLEIRAVSGDVRARAPRFDGVGIETVSGDVELAGMFMPGRQHVVSTVSGDVELALVGGLTLAVRTVSGSVDCEHPDRRDGDGRRRPLVIGDGSAQLSVRTMSGDVDVHAGKASAARANEGDDAASAARFGFPPAPPMPPVSTGPRHAGRPGTPVLPGSAAEVTQVAPPEPAVAASAPDPVALGILEALARGEIDVAEAERRLADAPDARPAGAPAGQPAAVPAEAGHDG